MTIVPYLDNAYAGNVALIVDESTDNQFITSTGIESVVNNQFNDYLMFSQQSMYANSINRNVMLNYTVYTVDLLGYRKLYMQIGSEAIVEVFKKWKPLLDELLQQDMTNVITADTCSYSVLSGLNQSYMTAYLNRKILADKMFVRNRLVSSRLVNIAIPKSLTSKGIQFFSEVQGTTAYDGPKISKVSLVQRQETYNLTDFKYLDLPIGQRCIVKNHPDLRMSISMNSVNNHSLQILAVDYTVDDLYKLEQYLTFSVSDDFVDIQFVYNPNRVYSVTSNSTITDRLPMSTNTMQVLSTDMLEHAMLAKVLYDDKYILNADKTKTTYDLPAIYQPKTVQQVPVMNWRTDSYNYDDKTVLNQLQWTGYSYLYEPVQTNDMSYDTKLFSKVEIAYSYGNLHTFLLETPITARPTETYLKLHTNGLLDNLDTALGRVQLPIVSNRVVTFRNITYAFDSDDFDGKHFALVVKHVAGQEKPTPAIIFSSNYVVIVLSIDLTSVLQFANKTSVSELTIRDFYVAKITLLLPSQLLQHITQLRGLYTVSVDSSMSNVQLELPIS